ncbi:MAG TPA: response regulator transcription factor [Candidatus Dormibacteraeota bacterium]|nr:response regulator transcription factor [Candidatus Dormibacteraeota bacterium]
MIRVLVADDQAMVRAGLRLILEGQADIEVVGEAADGEEAQVAARRDHPNVVLMDIRMPRLDGIAATRKLIEHDPTLRVLVVTTFDADQYVFEALRAGASGFILKDSSPEQLVAAVRLIAAGDALLAPARTRRLIEAQVRPQPSVDATHVGTLTDREREVLVLMARGLDNSQIAEQLFVSEATVRTHVGHVLSKLDARSRVQAVVVAYESGLVRPGSSA